MSHGQRLNGQFAVKNSRSYHFDKRMINRKADEACKVLDWPVGILNAKTVQMVRYSQQLVGNFAKNQQLIRMILIK